MKRVMVLAGIVMVVAFGWSGSVARASLVPPPDDPKGPSTGMVGQNLTFSTKGHDPFDVHDYMFDWGDGSSLQWKGDDTQGHVYKQEGTYYVRAREKCPLELFVTGWSGKTKVVISGNIADTWALSVRSEPVGGIHISGDMSGKTGYVKHTPKGVQVTLSAPPAATVNGVDYVFQGWVLDGAAQGAGVTDLTVAMSANRTAVARYSRVQRDLSVLSDPMAGVEIKGNAPGTTNYATAVPDESWVKLVAPPVVTDGNTCYGFTGWTGLGSKIIGKRKIGFRIGSDKTVTATYGEIQMAVTYPSDAGIVLERGQRAVITWDAVNLPAGAMVQVLLVKGGGTQTWTLARGTTRRSVSWRVGSRRRGEDPYPDGDDYQIVVSAFDGAVMAESANPFAIASAQSLSVVGPTSVQGGADPMPQYSCIAHYDYGGDVDVTPRVRWRTSARHYARMRRDGLLATRQVASPKPCTIMAILGRGKSALLDGLDINLTP